MFRRAMTAPDDSKTVGAVGERLLGEELLCPRLSLVSLRRGETKRAGEKRTHGKSYDTGTVADPDRRMVSYPPPRHIQTKRAASTSTFAKQTVR